MNYHRHGEVVLKPIRKLPKEAKLSQTGKKLIIGHSESGHHHILTAPTTDLAIYEYEGKTYLHIPEEANLVHEKTVEKHDTQIIAPGFYESTIKRAYSYAEKIMKKVID